jgi:hypothetical protein
MTENEKTRQFLVDARRKIYQRILNLDKPQQFQELAATMDMPAATLESLKDVSVVKRQTKADEKLSAWEQERVDLISELSSWKPQSLAIGELDEEK